MSAMPKVGLAAAGPAKSKPRGSREKAEQNADADAPIGKFNPSHAHKTGRIGDLPTKEEIRHLGSGAFGAAVLVRRLKDGRRLVAKKCSVKDMEEKQRRMCFEEIALLQKVRHECVAQLVDFVWASKEKGTLFRHRPFEAQNVLSLVHKITTEEPAALPEDADPQLSRPERRPSAAEVLQAKGLEDAEKILQIYREALEKKSDRHQRRLAREEDAAAGKRPRRFSRSSSMSSECESSGNAAGFRGINLVDIARRQAGVVPKFQEEGASEDEEDEEQQCFM
eukprot:g6666.t1